jgi:hypothetical protein
MTPAQLDLLLNGLFIYEGPDGSLYKSHDYKLCDYGVKCVGRTGRLTDEEWRSYFEERAA